MFERFVMKSIPNTARWGLSVCLFNVMSVILCRCKKCSKELSQRWLRSSSFKYNICVWFVNRMLRFFGNISFQLSSFSYLFSLRMWWYLWCNSSFLFTNSLAFSWENNIISSVIASIKLKFPSYWRPIDISLILIG